MIAYDYILYIHVQIWQKYFQDLSKPTVYIYITQTHCTNGGQKLLSLTNRLDYYALCNIQTKSFGLFRVNLCSAFVWSNLTAGSLEKMDTSVSRKKQG